jgi:hypothetical protein
MFGYNTALKANTLTITPLMRLYIIEMKPNKPNVGNTDCVLSPTICGWGIKILKYRKSYQ